jgi:hypothetical protein
VEKAIKQCAVHLVGLNITISTTTMHGINSVKIKFQFGNIRRCVLQFREFTIAFKVTPSISTYTEKFYNWTLTH